MSEESETEELAARVKQLEDGAAKRAWGAPGSSFGALGHALRESGDPQAETESIYNKIQHDNSWRQRWAQAGNKLTPQDVDRLIALRLGPTFERMGRDGGGGVFTPLNPK